MWSKLIQFPAPTPRWVHNRRTVLKDLLDKSLDVKVCWWLDVKHLSQTGKKYKQGERGKLRYSNFWLNRRWKCCKNYKYCMSVRGVQKYWYIATVLGKLHGKCSERSYQLLYVKIKLHLTEAIQGEMQQAKLRENGKSSLLWAALLFYFINYK